MSGIHLLGVAKGIRETKTSCICMGKKIEEWYMQFRKSIYHARPIVSSLKLISKSKDSDFNFIR